VNSREKAQEAQNAEAARRGARFFEPQRFLSPDGNSLPEIRSEMEQKETKETKLKVSIAQGKSGFVRR
jgi:hypothetical protein